MVRRKRVPWHQWFLKSWLYLILIWLFTGFALGTLVLLFPLRIWVTYVRDNDLSDTTEKIGVVIMMMLLAIISFIIAWKLYKWHLRKNKVTITIISIALPCLCAIAALMLFMNPDIVNRGSEKTELSQQFTIGPYPTEAKIHELKKEGYTGIISLLHPAVVPFEPRLIDEEEEAAKENKIEFVKAPMLPWVGDNSASLKLIEEIVRSNKGKYYVHCYLGKDRVNVVKNLIAKINGDIKINLEIGNTNRTLEQMKSFERGTLFRLDTNVYLTPYPTNEEFLAFFLAGKIRTVVNLMDNSVKDNKQWISKEAEQLEKTHIDFRNLILKDNASEKQIAAVVDSIIHLPRPVFIHRWNTSEPDIAILRKLYYKKTGKAPLNLATNVQETF